jgi:hypothetical protein
MSLAIYASPFDTSEVSEIEYKKQLHNKTQKRALKDSYDTNKVKSVLQSLHNNSNIDDYSDNLGDFTPPPKPESIGATKKIQTEEMQTINNNKNVLNLTRQPETPNSDSSLELNDYNNNYTDEKSKNEYYKKYIPNYTKNNNNTYYNPPINTNSNDILLNKLNYMIHLLEEKQDEKTNNVTEEVVMYSFLGIFMIFICDSFSKVGKYIR